MLSHWLGRTSPSTATTITQRQVHLRSVSLPWSVTIGLNGLKASYHLKQSVGQRRAAAQAEQNQATAEIVDSNMGESTRI